MVYVGIITIVNKGARIQQPPCETQNVDPWLARPPHYSDYNRGPNIGALRNEPYVPKTLNHPKP